MHLDYLHTAEHPVCRIPARYYRILNAAGEHAGNINLRLDTTEAITRYAGHIGYEVFPEHRGYRYAAQAVRLMIPIARDHGIHTLWITCDPENTASRRTLELADATYVETVSVFYNHAISLRAIRANAVIALKQTQRRYHQNSHDVFRNLQPAAQTCA